MKLIRGTVIGGVAFLLLGYLVWGILLMNFMSKNFDQSIMLPMDEMIWWAMILSNFAAALMLTLILKWAQAKTLMDGLKVGAIIGALYALSVDLSFYAMSTIILNLGAIVVDVLANIVVIALLGLVIVLTWGKKD